MKKGKVRLTRAHTSGVIKIHDRKPKLNESGKPIKGKYEPVTHGLTTQAFKHKSVYVYEKDGKTKVMDTNFKPPRPKMKKVVVGKPFEVNDVDYVMQKHGSILEVVK